MKENTSSATPPHDNRARAGLFTFRDWTIGRRVTAGFTLVIAFAVALGVFAVAQNRTLSQSFRGVVDERIPALDAIARVQSTATQSRLLAYKHISSPDDTDKAALERQFQENADAITRDLELYAKIAKASGDSEVADAVLSVRAEYRKKVAEIFEQSRSHADVAATYQRARTELDPIAARYAAALQTAADLEAKQTADTAKSFQSTIAATVRGISIGLVVAGIAGAAVGFFIVRATSRVLRSVSETLEEGSEQVASSSHQVSAASQSLAEGSSEQAASLEETGSSLEEMASMTRRNSESAAKANDLARQARQAADAGAADMQTMSAAMADLKASSDDIAKIIKTIDEIAFQTNILALNAAVEAARAGSAGAGFAVVADEVRALAQRSAQAAKETAAKIDGTLTRTAQGVQISGKVSSSLADIVEKVRLVDQLITEVSTASREQSQGVDQINGAVSQMDKVVQSAASNAEETAAAAEELSAQASRMRAGVGELMALVDGRRQAHASEAPTSAPGKRAAATSAAVSRPALSIQRPRATSNISSLNGHSRDEAKLTFKDF